MNFSAEQLAAACGGRLVQAAPPGPVRTDTRALQPGDWFLALVGERHDAHDFLGAAAAAGAAGAIVSRVPAGWTGGLVLVPDTLRALHDLARAARARLRCPVVGVTGSAGKTTTRAMIAEVLGALGPVHQNEANLNNHIGVPLTLLGAPEEPAAVVLEMGMSGPGEIALLQDLGAPTVRLITLVAAAHVEGAGSLEGVARCKQELFDGARPGDLIVLNADDPRVRAMPLPPGVRVLRYGMSQGCDCQLQRATPEPATLSTRLDLRLPDGAPLRCTLPAFGVHLALNATAAAAIGHALGLGPQDIAAGLARYTPVGARMRAEQRGGLTVLNDAYNANPASMAASLEALALAQGRRRVAVLGDMLELGPVEAESHAEVAALAGRLGLELVALAGPRFAAQAHHCAGAGRLLVAPDAESLAPALREALAPGDLVLLKGSRGMRMERSLHWLPDAER